MGLIRDIDKASGDRVKMLRSLVKIVVELGVKALAEGIETVQEAEACIDIGFTLAQGYFYGRPAPPAKFVSHE
jgi:EAL domain-containing protein (putative c-di-GMP-specific phosphodiesterase class I)